MSTTFNHTSQTSFFHKNNLRTPHWIYMVSLLRITAVVVLGAFIWLLIDNQPLRLGLEDTTPLAVFWKVIVPVVPMILLVVPTLWRNICPLAFFNVLGHRLHYKMKRHASPYRLHVSRPSLQLWLAKHGLYCAMFALFALVPARLLLFNSNNRSLVILLVVIAGTAFVLGLLLPFKSGWCSSICPVYPVENAYGMSSLLYGNNTLCQVGATDGARQLQCGGCTRQCLDLKVLSASKKQGDAKNNSPSGLAVSSFISVFPGFVFAYLVLSELIDFHAYPVLLKAFFIYGVFALCMALSCCLYVLIRKSLCCQGNWLRVRRVNLVFVYAAFSVYYFMASPGAIKTTWALLGAPSSLCLTATFLLFASAVSVGWLWLRRAW
ncbi:MAG: hypothetical protein HY711_05095 [Candidatus Melainabacteria bacterium]|nr:hypothetical protein [Candidatus Melainabacteria bacterium]